MKPDPIWLSYEWDRLELLASCVSKTRRGERLSQQTTDELRNHQEQVNAARATGPWAALAKRFELEALDLDILASALAPEARPQLGWLFQELQQGVNSPYPCAALIQELFFLDSCDAQLFHDRLSNDAPLFRARLIQDTGGESYRPLRPTPHACQRFLGRATRHLNIPGAVLLPSRAGWEDLILPPRCLRALREFLIWITYREQVVDDWGALSFGGPVALFAGPSGTGKTLAAEVLATELGWPLYRVDLGLLVSKYIGETEKNLSALFDAAADREAILLFDEAESLFSKRGEVKEARDRYANMEVSHLLSRIERHQGPCILTSNLRQQLDAAFARRFQVVIEFPRPSGEARSRLWRHHLPPRAPVGEDVDTEKLGPAVQLTGGQIRNSALHAAFLAAAEGSSIHLRHVASATWTELGKDGREMLPSTLGTLLPHLPKEFASVEH